MCVFPWFDLKLDALNSCLFTYNTFIKLLYAFRALIQLIIRRYTSYDVDLLMMSRVNARNM
jgi:hypothetical protein